MAEAVNAQKIVSSHTMEDEVTRHQDFTFPSNMHDLKQIMLAGEQSPGTNYYQHGKEVAQAFQELMSIMADKKAEAIILPNTDTRIKWHLPKWLVNHQKLIYDSLKPKMALYKTYQKWHDCGKPFVKQLDEVRQAHYPDHALVSSKAWIAAGGDKEVASLIENDMVCHHLRSVPETRILCETEPNFLALMVTAVCEMHVCQPPNSDKDAVCPLDLTLLPGFKIKFKRIEYYGKVMMKQLCAASKIE